ncbi:RNA polymerase sigma factor SigJ [Planosporangium thailandense]|uniref:RNA polymerase sigma factor SigJ n=1 Tax=Planosporangium thailandense TaxID=765197 RepID=A0ABX0XV49_9ACTN|nr:RNA polymerase sigma factor SigJ [Planosporangium thailandense]
MDEVDDRAGAARPAGYGDGFDAHRAHLEAVAYRLLGSRAEAEDAVQEAWLRYAAADRSDIADLRGWLTTVTTRICLDVLRSARVRREAYVGSWLPEPIVTRLPSDWPDPADAVARTDEVSLALLTVLERLSPEQRVAFVLHDVFAVPFDEIATTLDTTVAAARQLASRARRAVADSGVRRHSADRAEQQRVLAAFMAAAGSGDLDGLLAVLAPEVVVTGDGGGVGPATRTPVTGRLRVARFLLGLFRQAARNETVAEPVLVNGDLGLLAETTYPNGQTLRLVMAFTVADGRITAVYDQLNPAKLARVPRTEPARAALTPPPGPPA